MSERVLDWRPRFDERSRAFPIRAVLDPPPERDRLWRVREILDQGREGACVGFGWTAEALATPVAVDFTRMRVKVPLSSEAFARSVYRAAQHIDEWEGEAYEGTSVLAGAKVMAELGLLREYRWAFSIHDVLAAVIAKGPVVLGVKWYAGMYAAPGGILRVSGRLVGGHCLLAVGYRMSVPELGGRPGVVLQNSWGTGWGVNGLATIGIDELGALLADGGEACVPSRRSYGR